MAEGLDFAALAAAIEELRETLRAMVAGIVADGFTEEQARVIITGGFANMIKRGDSDG